MTGILPLLATVATLLAGHPTHVACTPLAGLNGTYDHASRTIVLTPDVCENLRKYTAGVTTPVTAYSVLIFAHESMHAQERADWLDETSIECRAISEVGRTAIMLYGSDEKNHTEKIKNWAWYGHLTMRKNPGYAVRPC